MGAPRRERVASRGGRRHPSAYVTTALFPLNAHTQRALDASASDPFAFSYLALAVSARRVLAYLATCSFFLSFRHPRGECNAHPPSPISTASPARSPCAIVPVTHHTVAPDQRHCAADAHALTIRCFVVSNVHFEPSKARSSIATRSGTVKDSGNGPSFKTQQPIRSVLTLHYGVLYRPESQQGTTST